MTGDPWTEVVAACRESMRALVLADPTPAEHPAKFGTSVLLELDHVITAEADRLGRRLRVIDPFAGTGRIHKLSEAAHFTVGIELEPEWAIHGLPGLTWVGDSTATPFPDSCADAIVTSPCYGNRLADHHEAKDPCNHTVKKAGGSVVYPLADCPKCKGSGLSPRNTYRHKLGRMPSRRSTAVMGWGAPFRRMHAAAIQEWVRLLGGGGLIVLNVSNHLVTVAKGEPQVEVRVVEWFCNEMMAQGCNIVEARRVATRRYRNGANSAARVDGEMILVMRTPPKVDGTLAAAPHAGGRRTENVAVGAVL